MMNIQLDPNQSTLQAQTKNSTGTASKLDGATFGEWLNRSIATVNRMQEDADTAAQKLVTGENKDIHGTMITMQKASIAMELMGEVRNKIISAYDEIKRMQF